MLAPGGCVSGNSFQGSGKDKYLFTEMNVVFGAESLRSRKGTGAC